jgi:hypothetical protein
VENYSETKTIKHGGRRLGEEVNVNLMFYDIDGCAETESRPE